jgi:hypothetical protein
MCPRDASRGKGDTNGAGKAGGAGSGKSKGDGDRDKGVASPGYPAAALARQLASERAISGEGARKRACVRVRARVQGRMRAFLRGGSSRAIPI